MHLHNFLSYFDQRIHSPQIAPYLNDNAHLSDPAGFTDKVSEITFIARFRHSLCLLDFQRNMPSSGFACFNDIHGEETRFFIWSWYHESNF